MIFGIKTKKDKKIEELQDEIERMRLTYLPTRFEAKSQNVVTWVSCYEIPFDKIQEIPEKHIKSVLTNKMLEVVENNLEMEYHDEPSNKTRYYRAILKVVQK